MESQNKTLDEVAEQNIRYLLPRKISICRCGGIPKLVGWVAYTPILECEYCEARFKGGISR